MPVNTRHPEYGARSPDWRLVRDCVRGQRHVRDQGEAYLPMPPGMKLHSQKDVAYGFYRSFTQFPDLVGPALRGMVGTIHRKPPASIELPDRLAALQDQATIDGLGLIDLNRRITEEVLQTGRYGVLVDIRDDSDPYLAGYVAESIVNWHVAGDQVQWVVLDETTLAPDDDDPFVLTNKVRYRVLSLEDGRYTSSLYMPDGKGGFVLTEDPVQATQAGQPIDRIPFVFIGSTDLTPAPDDIPLLGIAERSIAAYQKSAAYGRALFLVGDPTPVIVGMSADDENAPRGIGSTEIWFLGGDDGGGQQKSAFFLEVAGGGLTEQREAIDRDVRAAVEAGARLLDTSGAESGEALRVRQAAKHATIKSVAMTTAMGLRTALAYAAEWVGADAGAVVYEPNLDFVDQRLPGAEMKVLTEMWQSGAISQETYLWNLMKGEVLPHSVEDEMDLIEQEAPALGLEGRETAP